MGHLFLLGSELLYAVPHDGEIARNGLELLHQLRSCGRGGRWCGLSDKRWLRKCRMRGHLTGRGGARLLGCNVDVGGDFVVETDDSQPSDGVQVLTISFASSP